MYKSYIALLLKRKKAALKLALSLPLMMMNACSQASCCLSLPIQGDQSSIHYMVIGFGIISVPKPEQKTAVLATKMQSLGVSVSNQPGMKIGIGYTSGSLVAVPNGAEDVRVEVSQKLGGPLIVETQKAQLTNSKGQ